MLSYFLQIHHPILNFVARAQFCSVRHETLRLTSRDHIRPSPTTTDQTRPSPILRIGYRHETPDHSISVPHVVVPRARRQLTALVSYFWCCLWHGQRHVSASTNSPFLVLRAPSSRSSKLSVPKIPNYN